MMSRQIRLHYHNDRVQWRVDSPDVPDFCRTAPTLRELRTVACSSIALCCSGPVEVVQQVITDSVLEDEIKAPRHRGTIESPHGYGIVQDKGGGNVLRIAINFKGNKITQVAFLSFGDPTLAACASFTLDAALGNSLRFAAHLRVDSIAHVLALEEDKVWCAALVVEAITKALKGIQSRKIRRRATGKPAGAPRGHHLPKPVANDHKLLRPGETLDDLMRERGMIVGAIENMAHLIEAGTAAHNTQIDRASSDRESLHCIMADLALAIPLLSSADQKLIALLGLDGLTQQEAAQALGTSQPAVHKQLWAVARRIQRIWRGRL